MRLKFRLLEPPSPHSLGVRSPPCFKLLQLSGDFYSQVRINFSCHCLPLLNYLLSFPCQEFSTLIPSALVNDKLPLPSRLTDNQHLFLVCVPVFLLRCFLCNKTGREGGNAFFKDKILKPPTLRRWMKKDLSRAAFLFCSLCCGQGTSLSQMALRVFPVV